MTNKTSPKRTVEEQIALPPATAYDPFKKVIEDDLRLAFTGFFEDVFGGTDNPDYFQTAAAELAARLVNNDCGYRRGAGGRSVYLKVLRHFAYEARFAALVASSEQLELDLRPTPPSTA